MLLSIIVPIFNAEEYLAECIDSILNQTYTDFELILVNDGSTDGSKRICEQYCVRDKRIRLVNQENRGPQEAVYTGVMIACGEYIGFVDSDDWIAPQMFEKLLEIAFSYHLDCVKCAYYIQDENGKMVTSCETSGIIKSFNKKEIEEEILRPYWEIEADLYRNWSNGRWDKIWKRSIILEAFGKDFKDFKMGEDLILNLRYLPLCESIGRIDYPLYYLRYNNSSLSHGFNKSKYFDFLKLIDELEKTRKEQRRAGNSLTSLQQDLWAWCAYFYLAAKSRPLMRAAYIRRIHHKCPQVKPSKGADQNLLKCFRYIEQGHYFAAVCFFDYNRIIRRIRRV